MTGAAATEYIKVHFHPPTKNDAHPMSVKMPLRFPQLSARNFQPLFCPIFFGGVPMVSLQFQAGVMLHVPGLDDLRAHSIDRGSKKGILGANLRQYSLFFSLLRHFRRFMTIASYDGRLQ